MVEWSKESIAEEIRKGGFIHPQLTPTGFSHSFWVDLTPPRSAEFVYQPQPWLEVLNYKQWIRLPF